MLLTVFSRSYFCGKQVCLAILVCCIFCSLYVWKVKLSQVTQKLRGKQGTLYNNIYIRLHCIFTVIPQISFLEEQYKVIKCSPTERARFLWNKCKAHRDTIEDVKNITFFPKQILVSDEHKLLVCLPAKTGSSNFKNVLIKASSTYKRGKYTAEIGQDQLHWTDVLRHFGVRNLNDYSRKDIENILQTYTKVIVVRNPMVRVYSAYREKLVRRHANETCARHRKHMAPWIARIARPKSLDTKPETCPKPDITFEEFLTTFAKYPDLIKTDVHWSSVEDDCLPCTIKFDHVLRLETGHTDLRFFVSDILNQSDWSGTERIRNRMGSFDERQVAANSFRETFEQFQNISSRTFERVKLAYSKYMQLFGYQATKTKRGMTATCAYISNSNICC